ncbi:protein-glutamate O-methyltransferase CheR [Vibrio sp. ZSDE26]|uniref:Chemotaxis protein methyltransferase n=1 Tax=Vibrio amylolyticus TaxID=2847292 RepID=A0A9X1XK34_9VIBR|nr:protein-glutamate O-methyltransferase CheR [Vibrio amylolyticus]MCK6264181.1 protein-glutamate O-methyltransferase CheR [Vibrio amylolyticus]
MGRVLTQAEGVATMGITEDKEFELTDKDFKYIQWYMHKSVGIFLSDRKRTMVYGRLSRQMRAQGVRRFTDYKEIIENSEAERINFINSLTTNKTEFFREMHHFEFLEGTALDQWKHQGNSSINIWSAGCSTGQEPYSIVSSLFISGAFEAFDTVNIFASDLDTSVLDHAKAGIYDEEAIETIPEQYLKSCFVKGRGQHKGKIKIKKGLQQQIIFNQLNLFDEWPKMPEYDLISCRNVMIYFDRETQIALLKRFHQALKPNGILFIGHSESAGPCSDIFHHLGHTIYVKQ